MNHNKYSDEELMAHIQRTEGKGYGEIIERYQIKLFGYLLRMLKDKDEAEDVLQETFIAAYENLNAFDTKRKFSSWIYRIARNKALNEIRHNKKSISLEEAPEVASQNDGEKIEHELDQKQFKKVLEAKIQTLPLKYREVIILRFLEEKSYEEIGDILKLPTGTVGVRIKRGLERLRKIININPKDYL